MTDTCSNAWRAQRFERAVLAGADQYEDELPALPVEILADARHWCDASGHGFADLDRQAYAHYLRERDAERGGHS